MPDNPGGLNLKGKIALLLATTLALLSTAIVSPAMPDIAVAFSENMSSEWLPRNLIFLVSLISDSTSSKFIIKVFVLSVPALFIVLGAPLAGMLADQWGKKRVLAISLAAFSISGVSGFFVDSLTPLLIGRAILGLSVAGIVACTVAMVGDYFYGEERNKFIGLQGAAMKGGGVLFLLLGGLLADISWRMPFLVYLVAFVALPGVIFYLYDIPAQERKPSAEVALSWLPVNFVLFTAFAASAFYFMILVQTPFFLDQAFSASRFQMGLASVIANIVAGLVATVFFVFKARFSYVAMFAFIYAMIGIGYAIVAVAPDYRIVLAGLSVAGLGIGLIVPAQSAWMLAVVPAERRGFAIGLVATAMYMGQFIAPIMIEPFVNPNDPFYIFVVASGTLLALSIVYAIIAWISAARSTVPAKT
jgi:MFS family permease